MPPRRRLTPEQRRSELLDVGERVFGTRPFEDVAMDDIAESAGVTRALLYHYFRTKAEYFGAIWSRAHERLGDARSGIEPPAVRAGVERILQSYLDFYAAHLPLVIIANRSSIARDPAVREPVERTFAGVCAAVLDAAGVTGRPRRLAEAAFTGWIAFVRETTLSAHLDRRITPAENLALCMAAFDATVGAQFPSAPSHDER
ncbi:TetR/AcrR family transcriptional regulator [Nocardia stercoris]|uniref:TetR/AcrR family transcriptional regulator n=1 Tax=Nocardia stercoris TaxID=2483361 RepID=A0A3M2KTE0_9NOCA|nr:TetR/AcrR family transcriptional regulator [Nocardia stercoris]RMI28361.1 TetR/AcrR family transcriptional regulator [Nocardia stercoris]